MKDQRASKRRRVSGVDEEGDMEMHDADDIYSVPSSPSVKDEGEEEEAEQGSPTASTRASRRRSSRANQRANQDNEDEANIDTPTRSGLRSSGRQRKAPQRFEQQSSAPSSEKKTAATPTRSANTHTSRSRGRARQVSEQDEEDGESPQPQATSLARTRSKRAVKFNVEDQAGEDQARREAKTEQSPSPDEDQDGFDDLVAMQLQEGLSQPEVNGKDDIVPLAEPLPDYTAQFQALAQSDSLQDELRVLTQAVLEKLNGKRPVPLKGLENEYQKVHHLVEQTVTAGEGNSMLILGSRGSGKTAIVDTVLSSLAKEHVNDFHVVRLNGFLHTDDRLALREMWRQLGREMNTEEEARKVSSYADTMATLLALLSHPEELFGPSEGQAEGMTAAKSIVILLDEFDLFVSHPRQTLLYNLFDIAQARKAPVAVIGITTKVDVTEMLEKRVKSRFSHRYVFVPLPRTLESFSEICFAGLDLEDSEVTELAGLGGEKGRIMKSERWWTLLDGWKTYLKVWISFPFHDGILNTEKGFMERRSIPIPLAEDISPNQICKRILHQFITRHDRIAP